jgi:hypothetical protein
MKMDQLVNIETRGDTLAVRLVKPTQPDVFFIFAAILAAAGQIIIALFIFNCIWNDGVIAAKILFVILGLAMLRVLNMQFRSLLLAMKGEEEIRINDHSITYISKFGLIKKQVSFENNEIQKIELIKLGNDKTSQLSKRLLKFKYGTIVISAASKVNITFGQALERQGLERVYNALKLKIELQTESNVD